MTMVLEKQDSGISLSTEGTDCKMSDVAESMENLHFTDSYHNYDEDSHEHVPLHKTVHCALCR